MAKRSSAKKKRTPKAKEVVMEEETKAEEAPTKTSARTRKRARQEAKPVEQKEEKVAETKEASKPAEPANKRVKMVATGDEEDESILVRRTPASGRWWKSSQPERHSMVVYNSTKTLSTSWEKKMALRARRKEIKELEAELRAKQEEDRERLRAKRLEKRKRKAENSFKAAKVQVIRNTEKLKKMNKKQLRTVRKTQMDKDGNVQLVPMYSK